MSKSKENSSQGLWRKPAKSIKLVVKKRTRNTEDSSRILKTRNANTDHDDTLPAGQLKRHNPFGCSTSKKANITSRCNDEENAKFFEALDQPISKNYKTSDKAPTSHTTTRNKCGEVEHHLNTNVDSSINEDDIKASVKRLSGKKLPTDWSLKTRVRFTSPQPFNWCSKLLGKQEAEGLCSFVQCQDPDSELHSTRFQQNVMYWSHPTLPWLSLFPRLSSDMKLTNKIPNVAEHQGIADSLQASWSQSFRSVFNLLRGGYCDYFYLCSAQFTVLFRAGRIGGVPSTSAFITPTTKGIREGFDKEGRV